MEVPNRCPIEKFAVAPKKPEEVQLQTLFKVLRDHFEPELLVHNSRALFNTITHFSRQPWRKTNCICLSDFVQM